MLVHIAAWVVIIIATLLGGPAIVDKITYEQLVMSGVKNSDESIGKLGINDVGETTNQLFTALSSVTGLNVIRQSCGAEGGGFVVWVRNKTCLYADSASNALYMVSFRIAQLWHWILLFIPFFVAAAVDGSVMRKIRMESFAYTSPAYYKGIWHSVIAIIAFLVLTIPLAVEWPALYVPLALSIIAFLIRSLIANVQSSV